jgi:Chalcone isomerase-like
MTKRLNGLVFSSSKTPELNCSTKIQDMRHFAVLSLLFLLSSLMTESSEARHVLEGIHLPFEKTLSSSSAVVNTPHQLRFNGAGVRSIHMFGWEFKVYVAGFYTSTPLDSAESVFEALDDGNHMLFDFTFLRSVNQGRVTDAWKQQLEHSVEYTYPAYQNDRDFFIERFGPIEHGGTETIQLLADGRTIIIDQGVQKGVIEGRDFQKAFLSMWFGAKAVAPELKAGLLGKIGHFGLQPAVHNSEQHGFAPLEG